MDARGESRHGDAGRRDGGSAGAPARRPRALRAEAERRVRGHRRHARLGDEPGRLGPGDRACGRRLRRHVGGPGADCHPARAVSRLRARRRRRARHARRLRALPVSRSAVRVPDPAERDRARERDLRRRPGAGVHRRARGGGPRMLSAGGVFGPAAADLAPGAQNAVSVCLAIRPGERVALIADESSRAVAASLAAALDIADARTHAVLIEGVTPRPMREAPAEVLAALEAADAGILCVHPQEGELGARMQIVATVERRRIRYAHMVGVTPAIMMQGMRADYRLVDRLSTRLCERMRTAQSLRVTTPFGTALKATFDPSLHWIKTSGLISTRYWSNLPAGEVFTTPASVDGVFVCNATAGDYFGPKYGDLAPTPLTLEISGGR